MVEAGGEYVLQWDGHAGHVTERFSGLLARQALVDVTLICEEQKLRVHKLVLASCSLYFEEMLEQDLGQEPIIVLSDLDFEVLKAMVEFMYCGETTISQQHMEPLLHAARIFKVKELASIAGNMMGSRNEAEDGIEKSTESLEEEAHELDRNYENVLFNDGSIDVHTTLSEELVNDCSEVEIKRNDDTTLKIAQSLESVIQNADVQDDLQPTIYEETCDTITNELDAAIPMETGEPLQISFLQEACESTTESLPELEDVPSTVNKDESTDELKNDSMITCDNEADMRPMLYEQCDVSNNDTYRKDQNESPIHSASQLESENSVRVSPDLKRIPKTVGKCLKVYTHKRRKSSEGMRNQVEKLTGIVPEASSGSCIDLMDEASSSDVPVTLPTRLEMESTGYILSLSNEIIEPCGDNETLDSEISSSAASVNNKDSPVDIHEEARQMKEIFSDDNRILAIERPDTMTWKQSPLNTPTLRRSTRLIQQENDDSTNNNNSPPETYRTKEKVADSTKDQPGNNSEVMTRLKRKAKEVSSVLEENESDENIVTTSHSVTKSSYNSRSLRSTSKFVARNNGKSHLSMNRSSRGEQKPKTNGKLKSDKFGKSGRARSPSIAPMKFNTIATVSRALWGDMSDFLESRENGIEFPDYSPSKEIPFAVGLLPLRAALERMQAMPDYQPRKTRSSVTPLKHEQNSVKRKNCGSSADSSSTSAKRQNATSNTNNINGNTICHVHITATPPQALRTRRRLLPEQVATVAQTNVASRR